MKIYLIEADSDKFSCLKEAFAQEDVELVNCYFEDFIRETYVQCVVSPANSFGLMDGGYDGALTKWYGDQLQQRVQKYIIENFYGEQPVGTSFIIEANKDNQYLIHTPTMQTPQMIEDPRVIYQCMRSTLIEAKKNGIESILIPMFGGSTGFVLPEVVADMMLRAYKQMQSIPKKLDWEYAKKTEVPLPKLFRQRYRFRY
ncbi:MAG: macro domain-containing protein [Clostridia bacterium]|nr:macro domain-containing protein [Clostridia bacterium]